MATAATVVKIKKMVVVCSRCGRAKAEDAKKLAMYLDAVEVSPEDYNVCPACAGVVTRGMIKTPRRSKKQTTSLPGEPAQI